MSQICLTEKSSAPDTPPSNKVRIWVGNDGILRSIDDAGNITVYTPGGAETNFLQYTNTSSISTTSTTGISLDLATNRDSLPSTYLTKVNATDFRTNFNGYIRANFKIQATSVSNDRGYRGFIRKNATDLSWTEIYGWGKNVSTRSNGISFSGIIPCAVNDIFNLRFASGEGDNTTIDAERASFLISVHRIGT